MEVVKSIRNCGGVVDYCLSIFSYDFVETRKTLEVSRCNLLSLLTYDEVLKVAVDIEYINGDSLAMLREWRESPFEWGQKHGFPRDERK